MKAVYKRWLLFLIGCLGTRSAIAYAAYAIPIDYLFLMGIAGVLLVLGLLRASLTNRTHGIEMLGQDKIWWQRWRYVHMTTWTLFSVLAFLKTKWAWMILAGDVGLAFLAFILHYAFKIQ